MKWLLVLALFGCGADDVQGPLAVFGSGTAALARPWPNDLQGPPTAIPPRPDADPAVVARLTAALGSEDGFGATTGVFFPYQGGAIDPASLTDDSAFLVDLASGNKIPVERHAREDDHVIVVAPRPGEVLIQRGQYAAVLLTDVRDSKGGHLRADRGLAGAMADASYQPLVAWLAAHGVARNRVAAATVYTVHSLTPLFERIRNELQGMTSPHTKVVSQFSYTTPAQLDDFFGSMPHDQVGMVVNATVATPYYLSDSPAHLGLFTANADVQTTIDLPLSIVLPANGGMTATFQAVRAVVFVHGLNGQRDSVFELANDFCSRGYALVAADMPYHGARQIAAAGKDVLHNLTGAPGADGLAEPIPSASALEFADLIGDASLPRLDPRAPRDAFRQGIIEAMWIARMIQDGDLTEVQQLDARLAQLSFDPTKLLLIGESFGSFLSVPALAVEPRYQAGLLSVPGGGLVFPSLVNSLEYDPQFEPVVQGALGIDDAHRDPVVHPPQFLLEYAMVQQVVEGGDALAFAPYLIAQPIGANVPKSIALLEAYADESVPNRATEPLAFALGVHLVSHSGSGMASLRYIPPLPVDSAPVIANLSSGASQVTGVLMQFDPATHGMLTDATGQRDVEPDWPPVVMLPSPVAVTNPTAALHKLALRYADTFFEMPAPQIIDPFR